MQQHCQQPRQQRQQRNNGKRTDKLQIYKQQIKKRNIVQQILTNTYTNVVHSKSGHRTPNTTDLPCQNAAMQHTRATLRQSHLT